MYYRNLNIEQGVEILREFDYSSIPNHQAIDIQLRHLEHNPLFCIVKFLDDPNSLTHSQAQLERMKLTSFLFVGADFCKHHLCMIHQNAQL